MRASSYAHALYRAVKEHPEHEAKLLSNFGKVITQNGHAHLFPKVLRSLNTLIAKEERASTIEVMSASPLEESAMLALLKKEPYKLALSQKHKRVTRKIDPTLIGGVVVRTGGMLIDGSHKRSLLDIYQSLINR